MSRFELIERILLAEEEKKEELPLLLKGESTEEGMENLKKSLQNAIKTKREVTFYYLKRNGFKRWVLMTPIEFGKYIRGKNREPEWTNLVDFNEATYVKGFDDTRDANRVFIIKHIMPPLSKNPFGGKTEKELAKLEKEKDRVKKKIDLLRKAYQGKVDAIRRQISNYRTQISKFKLEVERRRKAIKDTKPSGLKKKFMENRMESYNKRISEYDKRISNLFNRMKELNNRYIQEENVVKKSLK